MGDSFSKVFQWWRIDAIGLAACVLLTWASYLSLIRPEILSQAEFRQQQMQITQRSQDVQQARASLSRTRVRLGQTDADLREMPLTLEPASQVNLRLAKLADLATEAGLQLHQIQPDSVRAGKRYDVVPITLSGSGDYRRVTLFLRSLHGRFSDVAVVRFDLTSDNPGTDQARFELGLAWYTMPALGFVQE